VRRLNEQHEEHNLECRKRGAVEEMQTVGLPSKEVRMYF
jgi:hypothetical protein